MKITLILFLSLIIAYNWYDNHWNGWRSMDTAPRDGSVIEIEILPSLPSVWHGVFKWGIGKFGGEKHWIDATDDSRGLMKNDEKDFRWRPYYTNEKQI